MTKRMLSLALALCMALLLFASCGRSTDAVDGESAPDATTTEPETETTTEPEFFTDANGVTIPIAPKSANVTVHWVKDVKDQLGEYESVTADTSEPQSHLVFTTDRTVTNFCVLSLFASDADENGDIRFTEYTVERLEKLTPDRPLVLHTCFVGDIPNNGIRFTDTDGMTRHFTVSLSGEDGSLLLTEYQ